MSQRIRKRVAEGTVLVISVFTMFLAIGTADTNTLEPGARTVVSAQL